MFGTAVFLYGGLVFLRGAWRELEDRLPGMMTLISLAITVAFVFSVVVTLGYPGMALWEELATLVTPLHSSDATLRGEEPHVVAIGEQAGCGVDQLMCFSS